jgi:hypothetical protein
LSAGRTGTEEKRSRRELPRAPVTAWTTIFWQDVDPRAVAAEENGRGIVTVVGRIDARVAWLTSLLSLSRLFDLIFVVDR